MNSSSSSRARGLTMIYEEREREGRRSGVTNVNFLTKVNITN